MKTATLKGLAEIILDLTWNEMQEVVGSDGFCSSYSAAEPKKLIAWAERQLKTEEAEQ